MRRLLFVAMFVVSAAASAIDIGKFGDSVYLLYAQDESGGMAMRCTATAFDSANGKTYYVTAAHCVTAESTTPGRLEVVRSPMYVSSDSATGEKEFTRVEIFTVGKPDAGSDFAILTSQKAGPVIPLGDERKEHNGTEVVNIAAPAGLGKVYFTGHISLLQIDRPLYSSEQHVNWAGFILLQLPAAGGSSGSAIVSIESGKIIGLVVGGYASLTVGLPISRTLTTEPKNLIRLNGKDLGQVIIVSPQAGANTGPAAPTKMPS